MLQDPPLFRGVSAGGLTVKEGIFAGLNASGGAACVLGPGWCPAWLLSLGGQLSTDPDFSTFRAFGDVQKVSVKQA